MSTMTAARSIFRSTSLRTVAAKSARSPFRTSSSSNNSLSRRIFRCPAELSVCMETMQPFHTATASALLTSMLSISCHNHGWVLDGEIDREKKIDRVYIGACGFPANQDETELKRNGGSSRFWKVQKLTFELYKLQTSNEGTLKEQNMMPHDIISRGFKTGM